MTGNALTRKDKATKDIIVEAGGTLFPLRMIWQQQQQQQALLVMMIMMLLLLQRRMTTTLTVLCGLLLVFLLFSAALSHITVKGRPQQERDNNNNNNISRSLKVLTTMMMTMMMMILSAAGGEGVVKYITWHLLAPLITHSKWPWHTHTHVLTHTHTRPHTHRHTHITRVLNSWHELCMHKEGCLPLHEGCEHGTCCKGFILLPSLSHSPFLYLPFSLCSLSCLLCLHLKIHMWLWQQNVSYKFIVVVLPHHPPSFCLVSCASFKAQNY